MKNRFFIVVMFLSVSLTLFGQDPFVKASGNKLVKDGQEFRIKGLSFSNHYYIFAKYLFNPTLPQVIRDYPMYRDYAFHEHHDARHFADVKAIGFNTVRFALNGWLFETLDNQLKWREKDPAGYPAPDAPFAPEALAWLDQNVQWAEENQVYLILDMHVAMGGDWLNQSEGRKVYNDYRIWTDPAIQARLIKLWTTLAERYKDNPWVAAYSILNEPVTAGYSGAEWSGRYLNEAGAVVTTPEPGLAQRLIDEIRKVDTKHLIILDSLTGTNKGYDLSPIAVPQFTVNDNNVMYDFHFYSPAEYTHQFAYWGPFEHTSGGAYPNLDRILPNPEKDIWSDDLNMNWNNFKPVENGQWVELKDEFTVQGHKIALPMLLCRVPKGEKPGKIYFDNIKITESRYGNEVVVYENSLKQSTVGTWNGYSETHTNTEKNKLSENPAYVSPLGFTKDSTVGNGDTYSLALEYDQILDKDFKASWSSYWETFFEVKEGYTYTITAQVKAVGASANTEVGAQIYYFKDKNSGTGDSNYVRFNKEYVGLMLKKAARFGLDSNVPVSCSEFGTIMYSIERDGVSYGGLDFLTDIVGYFDDNGINWLYWNYGDSEMGLYNVPEGQVPDTVMNFKNVKLVDLFTGLLDEDQVVYDPWDPNKVYTTGMIVKHNNQVWRCKWWCKGDEPGSSPWGPWEPVTP